MLAALLCNLPKPTGGFPRGRVYKGVQSFEDWLSRQIDIDQAEERAGEADEEQIVNAVRILAGSPVPEVLEPVVETVKDLGPEIIADDLELRLEVMVAYYAFIEWRKREDEITTILLLM